MIVPGMFMVLAVDFMILLAMFIPWVGMLESGRVVGLEKGPSSYLDVGEATAFLLQTNFCGRAWNNVVCRTLHLVR